MTTEREADPTAVVINLDVARAWRGVRQLEAALAGDVDEAIRWLQQYGAIEWRRAIDD